MLCIHLVANLIIIVFQLNSTCSQSGIDSLIDEDKYLAIINSSGWPPTKVLTPRNKAEFMNRLIQQELVSKRDAAISAFGRGLELLGILTIIRQHEATMKGAFVYSPSKKLTSEIFLSLIDSKPPIGRQKRQVHQCFMEYIRERDSVGTLSYIANWYYCTDIFAAFLHVAESDVGKASLNDVLQFCTELREVPPMGLKDGITIEYLPEGPIFPNAAACFGIIRLPILDNVENFSTQMDFGILNSISHYGLS